MKWNEKEGYITYKSALNNLTNILGLTTFDSFLLVPELSPYITSIIDYVSKRLLILTDNSDLEITDYISEVKDIADRGYEDILQRCGKGLLLELRIDSHDLYVEGESVPYNHERFIFAFTNVMTTLVDTLNCTYSDTTTSDSGPCSCQLKANNVNEEWSSGIYPEDENYDYTEATSPFGWRDMSNCECTKNAR